MMRLQLIELLALAESRGLPCEYTFGLPEIGAMLVTLERARVVGVMDAWVRVDPAKRSHLTTGHPGGKFACCLTDIGGRTDPNQKKRFVADSEDAARAAAAKAIEAGEV